ncbi:carbohydrate porin [Burkholderia multivorans]|uniref:carbohydrate porin n=1 Tax=Burkholderia multivorans TaxID=87883 RepID=UPI0020197B27|nr:carbohydrate porin [Burkholderia multivorans]MCL4642869.1 carbohydrate porin [Burkholderia multivorans]UQN86528.1 carbohydrate porin [Burkholderia multivorans]UQO71730.1 carbohydrate porin [Burkholderia multivorans]UQP24413.1 carbohydrate porin [Burkholderia multivorans]UQP35902.1 carbohydrate porin [Burkholderia multivorans]
MPPVSLPGTSPAAPSVRVPRRLCIAALACAAQLLAGAAVAQQAPAAAAAPASSEPGAEADSLWTRDTLLGDIGGLRPWLGKYGVTLAATETSELLANLHGGLERGVGYHGVTTVTLGLDTEKAFGWKGGSFNASALQIHGRQFSQSHLGTLNTASGTEADAATRLWELWYQQSLLDDRVDVKIGQQAVDQEFLTSTYSATFMNTMFGWPALPSYDLPSGGPAYPLSALGVRVRAKLTPSLTALAGVFDGDPLGNNPDNHSGTNFNLHNGALFIGELQYAINQDGAAGGAAKSGGLPGTYKLGVWYHSGSFADQRDDTAGHSLASADSTGIGRPHRGDYSVYAVADQMVWRAGPNSPRSLGVFARVMAAPGDRNVVSAAANLGVVLKAPFAGRDNDPAGLALTYVKVGRHARALDEDARAFGGAPYGVRGSETALEATYNYQAAPWWQIQADAQYTFNAGAGQNPDDPRAPLHNTFVLGVRTTITF